MTSYLTKLKNLYWLLAWAGVIFLPQQALALEYSLESYLAVDSLEELIVVVLRVLVTITTPIIVLFIIYAGFLYVTARGNTEQTQKATRALVYAVIGGILILGAVTISEILANVVGEFTA